MRDFKAIVYVIFLRPNRYMTSNYENASSELSISATTERNGRLKLWSSTFLKKGLIFQNLESNAPFPVNVDTSCIPGRQLSNLVGAYEK